MAKRRDAILRAAYNACIAIDATPSRRNLAEMVKRITGGRGYRDAEIGHWLASAKEERLP